MIGSKKPGTQLGCRAAVESKRFSVGVVPKAPPRSYDRPARYRSPYGSKTLAAGQQRISNGVGSKVDTATGC